MTWKIQKVIYADGLTILALAGLQFEEALGLSVVLLDPPPQLSLRPRLSQN